MIKIFQKNHKQKILAICIIMILSVSVSATFAKASSITNLSSSSATYPTTNLNSLKPSENISSYLAQLGYTEQNISSLSGNSITKLLLSQGNQSMNKSMQQINQDLFGNSTGPIPVPQNLKNTNMTNLSSSNDQASLNSPSPDTPTSGQACLIVAITDYPYLSPLYYDRPAFDAILYNVNNAGYDDVKALTNSSATHTNIWEWVTWMCASYQYVDVYFIGHGCNNDGWGDCGYVSYDAVDSQGLVIPSLEYYPSEMISYNVHPYDYSELRLGVGAFCYGGTFNYDFVYQGANYPPPPCDRVWIGPSGTSNDQYVEYFLAYWGYYWYPEHYDSTNACNDAVNAASPYIGSGETAFSNYYGLAAIYFPVPQYCMLDITTFGPEGDYLFDANIYIDGNYAGEGTVDFAVPYGWHSVSVDSEVYDYNLFTYVENPTGTGNYLATYDTTYISINYQY